MSRSKLMAAITAAYLMVVVGSLAWAQGANRDSCMDGCERAKAQCINTCTTHDNPMECEEKCQDTLQACTRQCGRIPEGAP